MTRPDFKKWLERYGMALEKRDSEVFASIFSPDVEYYWTPFEDSGQGRDSLKTAFAEATSTQEDIAFAYKVLGIEESSCVAHWRATFRRSTTGDRVTMDGIMTCAFDAENLCTEFREWWHSDEEHQSS